MAKTIFITGASQGFGRLWVEALLKRGDNVAATSRNVEAYHSLSEVYGDRFLPIQLDITDREQVFAAVQLAEKHFGNLDVVINNAGYGLFGAIEELAEDAVRNVFEANVFGALWITQAALPILREQQGGHIIQLSSLLGLWSPPTMGIYGATKSALEGFSEALAAEVKDFGIHVTIVEPNGYATDFGRGSAIRSAPVAEYNGARVVLANTKGLLREDFGDPKATISAILALIDSENPPLRFFLGKVGYGVMQKVYAERLQVWQEWSDVSVAAQG